jgi:hypothetical protein
LVSGDDTNRSQSVVESQGAVGAQRADSHTEKDLKNLKVINKNPTLMQLPDRH